MDVLASRAGAVAGRERSFAASGRSCAWRIALVCSLSAGCGSGAPGASGGTATYESHTYANDAGTRTYKLYTPARYTGAPMPLLVDLHGCSSNADEEARWSRFNELAETFGVLVAYPEQSAEANGSRCWNWFLEENYHRGAGEPSIIAGITREVMAQRAVDPARVYVAGISAGGAMADIMAVAYPDLYAAAMIYAGCEYTGVCFGTLSPIPAQMSGESAYAEMAERARVVPVLVLQGDQDPLVPYPNAELIVGQFLVSGDLADDGADNGSLPRERTATRSDVSPGGRAFEVDDYRDASGCLVAQRWLVHGMGHMWAAQGDGSPRDTALTDPLAPDLSTPTLEFLLSHVHGQTCTRS